MVKWNEPALDNTSTLSGIVDGVKPMEPPKLQYPGAPKSNPKSQTPIWDNLDNTTGSSFLLGKDGEILNGYRSAPGGAFRHISAVKHNELPKYTGWKIHLSVDIDDLPRATEIIAREAIVQGVNDFKVAYRDLDAFTATPSQQGKMFTFYDRGEDWNKILANIEQKITDAGIKPGASVPVDKRIKGSNYFAYRFDNDVNGGEYIPARDVLDKPNGHNPLKLEDKFENVRLSFRQPDTYVPSTGPKSQTPIWDKLNSADSQRNLLLTMADETIAPGYFNLPEGNFQCIQKDPRIKMPKETGWKLHLSVSIDDLPKATEIVVNEAIKQRINQFKIIRHEPLSPEMNHFQMNEFQAGKTFTFYDRGENWGKFIPDIEKKLLDAGIKPGSHIPVDKDINGSKFFKYRFDNSANGQKYIPVYEAEGMKNPHNPLNVEDKFEKIKISSEKTGLKTSLQARAVNPTSEPMFGGLHAPTKAPPLSNAVRGNIAAAIGIAAIESALDPNAVKEKIDTIDHFAQAGAQEKADIAAQAVRETVLGVAELGVGGTAQSANIAHRLIGNPMGVANEIGRGVTGGWEKTADYVAEQGVSGIASDIGKGIVQGTKNVMDVLGHAGGAVGKALDRDPLISGRGKTTPEMQKNVDNLFKKNGLKQRLENQSAVETPHLPNPNQHREATPQPTHGLATKQLVER